MSANARVPDPPLRVVILNDASVARGGATGLALKQARLLRARGVEVVFVTGDDGQTSDLRHEGVRVVSIGSAPLRAMRPARAATRGLYNPSVREIVARLVAEEDTTRTVYHVHSWSKTLTPAVFSALHPVAQRSFVHVHDFFLACPNGGFMDYQAMQPCLRLPLSASCVTTQCDKRNGLHKLWRVARQAVLHKALPRGMPWAGFLLIHPAMAPRLTASGYSKQAMVPLRNPARALVETRLAPERQRRVLFLGRVEAEKGVEDLIGACRLAHLPLTVVGDGPLRAALEPQNPAVRFTGWLGSADIAHEAALARVLVMPSRYPEPFGLVLAEASLSGLPVVVTDRALLANEVQQHGLGWVCKASDSEGLAVLLKKIDTAPASEIAAISQTGHSGAAKLCLTDDAWIETQLALYQRACGLAQSLHSTGA